MDGADSESSSEPRSPDPVEAPEERADEPEAPEAPPEPPRYEMELPSANIDVGTKRHFVKLPNFLSIGTHEYDPLYYEDEIEDDENKDYEGRVKLKLRVENTIRWRKTTDDEGNDQFESNARIVEWSDGTMSLYLGSEIFDVDVKPISESSHLFVRMGVRQGLQCQALFNTKLSIRPNSTESFTHRKLTLSLADRSQKTQKIRLLNNPGHDPEARLDELSKKEDDKLKASMRRETKQRRIQERSQSGGPSAAYLEDYDEEDDDGSISLSAIKRNTLARTQDYSEEEEESEQEYSDDSDPEFGKVQRRSDRKKKQVVEESDDDL